MTVTMTSRLLTFADYENGARIVVIEQAPKEKQLVFYRTTNAQELVLEIPTPWTYFVVTGVPRAYKSLGKRASRGGSYYGSSVEVGTIKAEEATENASYTYNFSRVLVAPDAIATFDSKLYTPPFLNMSTNGFPCIQNSIDITGDAPTMAHLTTQAWWTTPFNSHYPPSSNQQSPFMQKTGTKLADGRGYPTATATKAVEKAFPGMNISSGDHACLAFLLRWQEAGLDALLGDNVVHGTGKSLQSHIEELTLKRKQVSYSVS